MTLPARIDRVATSRLPSLDLANTPFGTVMSDHMLIAEHERGEWRDARIVPYGPVPLLPAVSSLQYGISVFEGMKAHRSPSGEVLLFRPELNARRLIRSAERLSMPSVPPEQFLAWLRELLTVDAAWVPAGDKGALYIRPTLFSIDPSIRVRPTEASRFLVFALPFASYYAAPIDVLVTERWARAFPGGTGDVKAAGNYAPALIAEREAVAAGCHSALWLDGATHKFVEECGVMNVFFVIDGRVVTPALGGTILPGVTRDSVVTLLRDQGLTVDERPVSIQEIADAHERGALQECFGTSTAATLSHISRIRWRDRDLTLPPLEDRRVGSAVKERLVAIATGREKDTHGWVVRL